MLTRINKAMAKKDSGFTLIELLVVVIIIGILAAIAIPTFLNQRQAGFRAAVESDLRNAATAAETFAVANGGLYTGLTTGELVTSGLIESENVDITIAATTDVSPTTYCITGAHTSLPGDVFSFNKTIGSPADTACGAAPATP